MIERIDAGLLRGGLDIVERLRERGFDALFAGGVVRDLLLGREVSDIDIATSARPEMVEQLFKKTIPLGRDFGVVIVLRDNHSYEVTTFRTEGDYLNGRHPSRVTFSSAHQDAQRRDFTVNALFLDPKTEEVIDYVAGRRDLEQRLIRTVGSPRERFQEDKLRIMRAVRFACRLRFEIESSTWKAVCDSAEEVSQVSWERIRDELLKMLTGPDPARALTLLFQSRILHTILPEVAALDGVAQPPQYHPEGDVFQHTRLMLELSEQPSPTLALGILLHDIGKPPTFTVRERIRFDGHAEVGAKMAAAVCNRLRVSREMRESVVDLVQDHLRFIHVKEMRESTLKRFLRKPNFQDHLELHRLDCLASHGDLSSYRFCRAKLEELSQREMRPEPLLRGRDLIELGYRPGPIFSEILSALEELQLEGGLKDRQEAVNWVLAHFQKSGSE